MAIDQSKNIYLAGLPITKLDSSGVVLWQKYSETNRHLNVRSIDLDKNGNVYTSGSFSNTIEFGESDDEFSLTADAFDIYVTKHNALGDLQWARKMGGRTDDFGYSVAVSQKGTVATTGSFTFMGDFDPGPQNHILPITRWNGNLDPIMDEQTMMNPYFSFLYNPEYLNIINYEAFVSTLDANGNNAWGGFCIYGGKEQRGRSVIFDQDGNLYSSGFYQGSPTVSAGDYAFNLPNSDHKDGLYLTKWRYEGRYPVWTRCFPNLGNDYDYSDRRIEIDDLGNVYISGWFSDTVDFDPGINNHLLVSKGDLDAFILKLNSNGEFQWVKQIGGELIDKAHNLDIDPLGNIIVTGSFSGTVDFDPNHDSFTMTSQNPSDSFVLKLNSLGQFCWAMQLGIPPQGLSVKSDDNSIYLTGYFSQPTDFDPGENSHVLSPSDPRTFFVMRLSNPVVEKHCPTDIQLSKQSIIESSTTGSEVGIISTIDDDVDFLYSLVEGEGDVNNNDFIINGPILRINTNLNYEDQDNYSIRIQTQDPHGCTYSKSFIINVLNDNEFQFSSPPDLVLDCSAAIPPAYNDHESFVESGGQISASCGINAHSFRLSGETYTESDQRKTITRTYEMADSCGNLSIDDHIITISDIMPPEIYGSMYNMICLSDLNYLFNPWPWSDHLPIAFNPTEVSMEQINSRGFQVSDNCSIKEITYVDELLSLCPFHMVRTYTVTDHFNNTSTAYEETMTESGIFAYLDKEILWGGCTLDDLEENSKLAYSSVDTGISQLELADQGIRHATGFGMCSGEELKEMSYRDSLIETPSGTEIRRTFTLIDYCNNTAQASQSIVFGDHENPVIGCPPAVEVASPDKIPQPYSTVSEFVDAGGIIEDNNGINPESFKIIGEYKDTLQDHLELKRTYYIEDQCGNASICLHSIDVKSLTSVSYFKQSSDPDYTILPNPNKGRFSFLLNANYKEDLKLELVTSSGQIIEQRLVSAPSASHIETYDISNLSGGTYFLIINSGYFRRSEKIVSTR